MTDLRTRLLDGPCVVLDGGMGSMLLARGLAAGEMPERMNLDDPDVVVGIHVEYVRAGSDAVQTNTFGGNPIRLGHYGMAGRTVDINHRAVELARTAEPSFVIGDMGPTGEYLPPVGTGEAGRWADGFRIQAGALIDAGVDAIHVETMSDLREAELALAAVREWSAAMPVLVSLTFDRTRRGFFTIMGNPLVPSLTRLVRAGATAVGANCSLASGEMQILATEALAGVGSRLVFQPNAGLPDTAAGRIRYHQAPERYASDLVHVVQAGAAGVGGCCGTDPGFIRALRALWRSA